MANLKNELMAMEEELAQLETDMAKVYALAESFESYRNALYVLRAHSEMEERKERLVKNIGYKEQEIAEQAVAPVTYVEMKQILTKLNKEWNVDFVSATAGDCCHSCSTMRTEKAQAELEASETQIIVSWFYKGMNYTGKMEQQNSLYIGYDLGNKVSIEKVCNDLQTALAGRYVVTTPEDDSVRILLERVVA